MRVARVAAGAVFLAGVSLTAVGTASALEGSAALGVSFTNDDDPEVPENTTDVNVSVGNTTEDPGNTTEDPGNTTEDPGNTTEDPGNTTEDPGNTTEDPGNTTEDPGNTTEDPGNTTEDPGNTTEDPGGDSNGGSTGGPDPATTGGTGGGGDEDVNTCILDESTVDCGPDTDSVGTKPISQEKPKEELAKTGAAETTFLLIGAATMIAGGVGFRLMPRMVNRNTVA
ncbi:hypothetical protein SAMN05192584_10826 [Streptomyces pini]|uniref:Uncharacterized protein n=1 Tax=Streptomyces pini TaxID=1520580 RepID=A0A1I4BJJ6_9ACTN|nr:hypothetical protein SAMN05192584_10826 [Streptomyces pini]